jgi:hypothetical protein
LCGRATLVSGLLVMGIAACVPARPDYSDISDYTETPLEYHLHVYARAGEVTRGDRYFVFHACVGDLYDIALADLAIARAASIVVKQLALRQRADAVADHQRLSLIAEQYIGVSAPMLLDRDHAFARDQIATFSGPPSRPPTSGMRSSARTLRSRSTCNRRASAANPSSCGSPLTAFLVSRKRKK